MTFDFEKFTSELHEQYRTSLSLVEIEELLGLNGEYTRDTPLSTGKRLVINNIAFSGVKTAEDGQEYSGAIINYSQKIESGVTIWIADNLKGKSSIFKIIKYALTGNSSLKPNIKKWLKSIILNFSISDKTYTVFLNTEKRSLQGFLYNGTLSNIEEFNNPSNEAIFSATSEAQYSEFIEEFFFKQFSYYSLRWTQKDPRKDRDDLLEVGASWGTYFKSILLESKDSSEMYGSQGKKVFQMLLSLELTYPINRLSVKKDLLNDEKVKQTSFIERQKNKHLKSKDDLQNKLADINNKKST